MVHIHHRKKTPGGCIERLARSGSCRESVRGVVGTMNEEITKTFGKMNNLCYSQFQPVVNIIMEMVEIKLEE